MTASINGVRYEQGTPVTKSKPALRSAVSTLSADRLGIPPFFVVARDRTRTKHRWHGLRLAITPQLRSSYAHRPPLAAEESPSFDSCTCGGRQPAAAA